MNIREKVYRLFSFIFRREIIRDGFRGVLGRDPEEEAMTSYEKSFEGKGLKRIISTLVKSQEHKEKVKREYSDENIQDIYRSLLDRDADELGLRKNSIYLKSNGLKMTLELFKNSAEFKNSFNASEILDTLYRSLLGRSATQEEIDHKIPFIKQNGLAIMLEQFVDSPEFEFKLKANSKEEKYKFNDRGPIVFVHCWKAGGSTLHNLLGNNFNENDVFWGNVNDLHHKNIHRIRSYSLISGHFQLSDINWIPGNKRVISMLRDPYTRMMSLYHFAKAHNIDNVHKSDLQMVKVAKKYSIEEFYSADETLSNKSLINNYTRTFSLRVDSDKNKSILNSAIENIKSLTSFGIMEKYDDSVDLIFSSLEIPIPKTIKKVNVLDERIQKGELQKINKFVMTDKLLDILQRYIDLDVSLYTEANKIFNERCIKRDTYIKRIQQ